MFKIIALSTVAFLGAAPVALADCKSDIQSVLQSMEAATPYHIDMTMEADGQTTKMLGDVVLPHSMSIKSDGMSMVMTPNGVWMAQGGGPLQKMPNEMKDHIHGMIKQGMNLGLQAVDNVECPGSAEFEGASYTLYKYAAKVTFMGIDTSSKVSMYVKDDGKPEWMVVDGEAMGMKSLTTQKLTFDDSIVIADPK